MRKVGIYVRVSTDEQAAVEEGSIKNQTEILQKYIKAENLKADDKWGVFVDVYKDDGFSAKDLRRPEMKRLLKDIYAKKIDTVIFTEISRFSRSVKDWQDLRIFFDEHEACFIASRQNFDTSNAMGRAMLNFAIEFSQLERELTAERVKASYFARAGRGLWTGGSVPFGLEPTEKNGYLIVNAAKQVIANEILDILLAQEGSLERTAARLTELGYTRQGGKTWDQKSLGRWIRNVALIGQISINTGNKEKDQSKLPEAEKYKTVEATWEAVVDREKWLKANNLLDDNYRHLKVEQWKYHEYILTGLLTCPEGNGLVGASGWGKSGTKYTHYRHSHKQACDCHVKTLSAPALEAKVLQDLKDLIKVPELAKALARKANDEFKEQQPTYSQAVFAAKTRLDAIIRKIDKISDQVLNSESPAEVGIWKEKLLRSQTERQLIEKEFQELSEKASVQKTEFLDAEKITAALEKLTENFESLPITSRQALLRSIVEKIVIRKETIDIVIKNPEISGIWTESGIRHSGGTLLVHWDDWRERWDSNPRPSP